MNFGTALRQGVGERVYKYAFWLWLPALGFDPAMVLLMIGFNLTYQFWTHTEVVRRLPRWFEAVFNTPSHHRVLPSVVAVIGSSTAPSTTQQ